MPEARHPNSKQKSYPSNEVLKKRGSGIRVPLVKDFQPKEHSTNALKQRITQAKGRSSKTGFHTKVVERDILAICSVDKKIGFKLPVEGTEDLF